ncbi:MAG TPA: SpoIID/LytB domain-containing protein [Phycisphaerales bacterium]|nr:SpoIID/LytB domain-containing protein [Phycisphaerales bacterium]
MSHTGAAQRVLIFWAAGVLLGLTLLVAWSCKTTRTGSIPYQRVGSPVEISNAEGSPVRPEPMIRVRIRRQTTEVKLSGRGPWLVAVAGARTGELMSGPVRIQASNGSIRLTDARGRVRGFAEGVEVYAGPVIHAGDAPGKELVAVGRTRYPGTLRLHPRPEVDPNTFDVVNVVEIERYVPGVISKELYPHWDRATFEAQAVAARTFALIRRESARRSGRWYDVDDSQQSQVYGGITGQRIALRAAADTRGVVLARDGRLTEAYYSSTCGGEPALPEEVWPAEGVVTQARLTTTKTEPAPRREVLCQTAPLFRWEVARRVGTLSKRFAAWGRARNHKLARLGRLHSIKPIAKAHSGRKLSFEVTDTQGRTARLTAEQLRAACNFPTPGLPSISHMARLHSGDVTVDVGRRVVRFSGHGSGHGVGLCQYCAQAMAQRGDDWRSILEAFYPKTQLMRIY